MSSSSLTPVLAVEPTYTRSVFEAILAGLGPDSSFRAQFRCDDRGAWVCDPDTAGHLAWHPMCELMEPGSPNPLDTPWLPFPFTARQLAAFMADGWGYFIQEKYGDWEDGPDPDELGSVGVLGGKAREALVAAYQAYRDALELAPGLDKSLAARDRDLVDQYREARDEAAVRHGLYEPDIPAGEYSARLARVSESVAALDVLVLAARKAANDAEAAWRRAVVQHLLLPIDKVPAESFRCLMLRSLPPELRARELHQQRAQLEFQSSEEGQAHWVLVSELFELERELRRWQLMSPLTVTEAVLHESKLKELGEKVADVKHRLDQWSWAAESPSGTGAGEVAPPPTSALADEKAEARRRRRLEDLRQRFNGDWVYRDGKWGVNDRQSGAFGMLVKQESENGSRNFSAKSVRIDLTEAAKAEAAAARAGLWPTGHP